ncbi:hypothetical protein KGP36_08365 [Patescibacteria group bacterium]|nr:hypothetical protein [Patescibacteria group bacterium]
MNESDYFLQRLRADTQLKTSLCVYLAEFSDTLLKEILAQDKWEDVLRSQGKIRALKRLIDRIQRESPANEPTK